MKNMNLEVFNLKSRLNEKTELFQHESCKCDWTEWRLTEGVYSSKKKWNHDERHCGCTELDAWSSCKDDCMWNPSTCDCDYNKPCKADDYSDIQKNRNRGKVMQKLSYLPH